MYKIICRFGIAIILVLSMTIEVHAAVTIQKPTNFLALNTGLVGWWTFDGPDMLSNVRDRSGQGNHGNLSGQAATTSIAGAIGQALSLDGTDDYVRSPDLAAPNEGTFATWVTSDFSDTNGPANFPSLLDTGGTRTRVTFNSGGNPDYYELYTNGVNTGRATYTPSADITGWFHLAVTWSASGSQFYKDGVAVGTAGVGDHSGAASAPLYIGARNDLARWWPGDIDDARVYSRALSAAEIKQLYNIRAASKAAVTPRGVGSTGLNSGLVGHWTFDGPDMLTNVRDRSGQGNHGNLVGQISTTTTAGRLGQALKFDGTDDYILISSGLGITDYPYTLSGWTNVRASDTEAGIIWFGLSSSGNKYSSIGTNGSALLGLQARFDGIPDILNSTVSADGNWHHVVGVYTSATMREIFIDGVSYGTDTTSWASPGADRTSIGAFRDSSPDDYMTGSIDDARIYNRALSASEIKQLYGLGR